MLKNRHASSVPVLFFCVPIPLWQEERPGARSCVQPGLSRRAERAVLSNISARERVEGDEEHDRGDHQKVDQRE